MQGKEVGSIIGKRGDNIKSIREESGARINISDGTTPERIVTMVGTIETLTKAFGMICQKFEDDLKQTCATIPPITLRLVVPASQCGSIIGKGGAKIKEIRESTGASVQVASEMLPSSTERAVTISGKLDSIENCFRQICQIMLESPPKGETIPYRPKMILSTVNAPIIFANGQAYQVQGQFAIPIQPNELNAFGHLGGTMGPGVPVPTVAPLMPNGIPTNRSNMQTQREITIANDLIGCIIGRGGQKISEIRQASGANIKIADLEEGSQDRHVTISGTPEQIQLAEFLIHSRIASEIGGILITH
ncbi:unnamed protein product [Didymodactylos carnosus]|uniref:K Homology domain-containing protein n=1 Tax=Didymodactylos carnosus TaxID=1234261 RepID=A0A813WN80_9BILA|nr:unnamed protein product [Didymodactylos carnosus]CAF1269854.1 unnamed protein product [Didymodactylos carnosus]CAF3645119.1 unnamed protein product [Didymodactylos carnosus]CAF4075521.1 unnamed protein product [Didymodactylos carnosus]